MGHRTRARHVATQGRREAAAERKAQEERRRQVREALTDEIKRFNAALADREIILPTAFGPYVVQFVTYDLDVGCHPQGQRRDPFNARTFLLANDERWHRLLAEAGVARHPLFAEIAKTRI